MSQSLEVNRSRNCHLCGVKRVRVHLPAPKVDDPDYVVAVCPRCDMTIGFGKIPRSHRAI